MKSFFTLLVLSILVSGSVTTTRLQGAGNLLGIFPGTEGGTVVVTLANGQLQFREIHAGGNTLQTGGTGRTDQPRRALATGCGHQVSAALEYADDEVVLVSYESELDLGRCVGVEFETFFPVVGK